jgi:tRNA threonylcarbamoyladenosine biosynthesis protein TsaB
MLSMLTLTIRSDKPEAELGLYEGDQSLAYHTWLADRQLAETIHLKIQQLLDEQGKKLTDLQGIVAYQGPGSFTGLRIGLSVANALAAGLDIPIVGSSSEDWIKQGLQKLQSNKNGELVMPEYGAQPHITQPRK